jgi:hypothetical protein
MWNQVREALNQSATNVLAGVAGLLPGALALVVSMLVATLLGWILAFVLRRALAGVDFDRRMTDWGWADIAGWTGVESPALLLSRVVLWATVFLGFVIGLSAFDPTLTAEVGRRLFGSAINLVTAVVILIAGNVLARFLARGIVISLVNMNIQHARLVSVAVKWLVLVMAAAMALDHLGIGGSIVELAFGILFGGIVLTLSLTIAMRSKELTDWSLSRREDKPDAGANPPVQHL